MRKRTDLQGRTGHSAALLERVVVFATITASRAVPVVTGRVSVRARCRRHRLAAHRRRDGRCQAAGTSSATQSEVRRSTELVVRLVSAIGNYDYVFDWVFRQDGAIRVVVGTSGVEQVWKGVASRTRAEAERSGDTAYGRLVAERTVAINHDHFFNFRLDFDVDGPRNSLVVDRLRTQRLDGKGPRRSIWTIDTSTVERERAARLRIDLERPTLWRVANLDKLGPLGYPTSYELRPGGNAVSLLSPDDYPQRRAGFTDFHLWVTPYNRNERYAAGVFPNQSQGGDGLPEWTAEDRPIENTDVVLWYTMGVHHVVRAEDWPVLPTSRQEFQLRPFDFFERNPALDIPK